MSEPMLPFGATPAGSYAGILCIGDPHLASRVPGFRKDDYPRALLRKLRWCLDYARAEALVPVILGDLFHYPRDNANRLLVEVLDILRGEVLAITGNHDCSGNELCDDDTLSVLYAAGKLRPIDHGRPWAGLIAGRPVVIGGSAWNEELPESIDASRFEYLGPSPLVVWVTHHDVRFPGEEAAARYDCREIPGVDVLVNGHVHREHAPRRTGRTTWLNPGNIARVNRGDARRGQIPGILRIDLARGGWSHARIEVPHEPFEAVFYEQLETEPLPLDESMFIKGLKDLQSLKTASGEGLLAFLDQNLSQFPQDVAGEIRRLAKEVIHDAPHTDAATGD